MRCDVSVRLHRKVHKDCTLSLEGSRYRVPHTLVGKRILIRFQEGSAAHLRWGQAGGDPRAVFCQRQTGGAAGAAGEAILGDREMNARKYASPLKGKAKATLSPPGHVC